MGYQVDFMAVGEGEKSGDAIALRFGDIEGSRENQTVLVVDGGTKDSGEQLCEHIRTHYGTEKVDYVICTHPDADHASGLSVVLENMEVGMLLMHRPWDHSERIKNEFVRPISGEGLERKIKKSLKNAHELEKIANNKGILIEEPFAGIYGEFGTSRLDVIGPSKEAAFNVYDNTVDKLKDWIDEEFHVETLQNGIPNHRISAENRSSVILLLEIEGRKILLTGDADEEALNRALDELEANGRNLDNLVFFQMPHHGSRHNIGPDVLDRILGSKQEQFEDRGIRTYISAAVEGAPKHPHGSVTNAAHRRGSNCHATQGNCIGHHRDAPVHDGWGALSPLPFVHRFEA